MGKGKQTVQGKGFEYACLLSLKETLQNNHMNYEIKNSKALQTAQNSFNSFEDNLKNSMLRASKAALKPLLRFEPNLSNGNEFIQLSIAIDKNGTEGDVRDIIIIKDKTGWEIGISCKHNHHALKHSRLSMDIDFGEKWLGLPVSKQYFSEIQPIFSRLSQLRDETKSLDKSLQNKWSLFEDKEEEIYLPILKAFQKELLRLYEDNKNLVPKSLIEYLLGKKDFYKVIAEDTEQKTIVQSFNMNNTLSSSYDTIKPQSKVKKFDSIFPSKIYEFDFKQNSKTTLILAMDRGWEISFRIHNASSRIEPSLKFDIQLIGIPQAITNIEEHWE